MAEKNIKPIKQSAKEVQGIQKQVDNVLASRQYFIDKVLPILKENQDYFLILGRKSLAKGGAEKLASIFNLVADFHVDKETMDLLKTEGMIAYVCDVKDKEGNPRGQGRGADSLARNKNDANKTIKMAQKRAYVDAVIRATGLSDIFTQDLEDMREELERYRPQRADKEHDAKKVEIKHLCDNYEPLLDTKEDYERFVLVRTGLELKPENYDKIIEKLKV